LAWHFFEINALMQFLCEDYETPMALAAEIIYPVLEKLALVDPRVGPAGPADNLLNRVLAAPSGFNIILTSQPRGSVATRLWSSSYLIFMESL